MEVMFKLRPSDCKGLNLGDDLWVYCLHRFLSTEYRFFKSLSMNVIELYPLRL